MKKKQKGWLLFFVGIFILSIMIMGPAPITRADDIDAAEQAFLDFLSSDTDYDGELEYTYSALYDENLNINGRQYNFSIGEVNGYALLTEIQTNNETFYEVEELFYNRQSPFDNCLGLPVYITHGTYLYYLNNSFYKVENNSLVGADAIAELANKGFGYSGIGNFTERTETISYATKSTESYSIPYDLPNYYGSVDNMTGCANTAGSVLIGYYDRFCENLIPNFKTYTQLGSIIRYKAPTTEIANVVDQLYILMETDVAQLGTTFSGFQRGMNAYAVSQGYTYTTVNMFTNGSLNIQSYKSAVQSGKPVALFLTTYAFLNGITEDNGVDTVSSAFSQGSHVVIGCGYKIDTYYNSSEQIIATRYYLKVATGDDSYNIGYLNINGLGNLDRAISVLIS